MEIIRAKHYGFCFWVKRAYEIVINQLNKNWNIKVWWELIHNEPALKKLRSKWMQTIEDLNQISWDVVIRSHWVSDNKIEEISKRSTKIYNATCPFVTSVHTFSKKFENEWRQVIIIWDWNHPEMRWAMENLKNPICILNEKDAQKLKLSSSTKIWIVVQTTLKQETYDEILKIINLLYKDIVVKNTICNATKERQKSVIELARNCDIVIIVWWKKSSNSKKLEELSSKYCITYKIEESTELNKDWFTWKKKLWISAWASTPDWLIDEVEASIINMI